MVWVMNNATLAPADLAETTAVRRGSGLLLAVVLIGQFMAVVDVSVVNVAAQTIRGDLHTGGAALQLVIAAYTAAYAVLLVTGARLGARWGSGRMFLAGLATFTLASLACGLAPDVAALIGFRAVQGAGAAAMVPQVLSLIQRHFSGRARARALSGYAAVVAGGVVIGQVAGGALVSADLLGTAWRPVFLVNVPIGVALLACGRLLPRDPGEPGRGMDPAGVGLLSLAVLVVVVPLVLGREEHWPVWCFACLGTAIPLLVGFGLVERRAAAPLVPGRVLHAGGLPVGLVSIALMMASYGGYLFIIALHLQSGLGYPPLRSGLTFVPMALAFALTSLNWRRIPTSLQPTVVPAGMLFAAAGLALLGSGAAHPGTALLIGQIGYGLGFGLAFSPALTRALARVPGPDAADASGLTTTVMQLAQVIGVATFGSAYLSLAAAHGSGTGVAIATWWIAVAAALSGIVTLPGTVAELRRPAQRGAPAA
jgi:MFS family permease